MLEPVRTSVLRTTLLRVVDLLVNIVLGIEGDFTRVVSFMVDIRVLVAVLDAEVMRGQILHCSQSFVVSMLVLPIIVSLS